MSEEQPKKKRKRRRRAPQERRGGCLKHDYAYCYFNKKTKENVYQCCNCGHFLYV